MYPPLRRASKDAFASSGSQNGGLPVFGYPLTPAYMPVGEGMFLTQIFERSRFEYHADKSAPYDVSLGRLGDEQLGLMGLRWQDFMPAPLEDAHFFPATTHAIAHVPFADYWLDHGLADPALDDVARSLALFGMPLSEPMPIPQADGTMILTQWFERARFEDHGTAGVLLGRLGDETKPAGPFEPAPVPAPLAGTDATAAATNEPERRVFDLRRRPPSHPGPRRCWIYWHATTPARRSSPSGDRCRGRAICSLVPPARDRPTPTIPITTFPWLAQAANTSNRKCWRPNRRSDPMRPGVCVPPYGATDANTYAFAQELGYRIVLWDVDPKDWQTPGVDAIVSRVVQGVHPGSIVLMHDGGGNRAQSVAALETILATLTAQGYHFEALCH